MPATSSGNAGHRCGGADGRAVVLLGHAGVTPDPRSWPWRTGPGVLGPALLPRRLRGAAPRRRLPQRRGSRPELAGGPAAVPQQGAAFFKEFKLGEPWDSAHNRRLLPRWPQVYQLPGKPNDGQGMTYYQVFVGPRTLSVGRQVWK